MNIVDCPLCGSLDVSLKESLSSSEIHYQYLRSFNIKTNLNDDKISYLICNDCKLGFFQPMVTGTESFYEQLQKFEWYYMTDKPEFNIAKKYISNIGNVLEVGSGKAAFASIVGEKRYVGLEFNDEAIIRAGRKGVTLLKETIEEHASNHRQEYATVTSFQVLEHVSNPSSFIQGCVDSLQHEGILIIAVPNHEGICGLTQNHLLDMPPHHVTHWSGETLTKIASKYGLELLAIELEPIAEYHKQSLHKISWEKRIRNFIRLKPSLLDYSFLARFISKVSIILAVLLPISIDNIKGHTVVAIYRKT